MSKKSLGQFFTVNYKYILQDMYIPEEITKITEPFAGNCDLLKFLEKKYELEMYDIELKNKKVSKRDTLKNPPDYTDTFILTNPPYLGRNKADDKTIFDKYGVNDLYKCFLKNIIADNKCLGGIIVIPLNFWSSIRKADIQLRKEFLATYNVLQLNIFEERVFEDTSYTVCSFQFEFGKQKDSFPITFYPSKQTIKADLSKENNYSIGGEIYHLPLEKKYRITRLTKKNKEEGSTNILVKCIDDNKDNQIGLSFVEDDDIYVDETPKSSARTYATLVIEPEISIKKQKKLVKEFNNFLSKKRIKYHSLFLTNFRESKDIARKRISFDLVYRIVGYLLEKE